MPSPYPIRAPLRNRHALAPDSRPRPGAHVKACPPQNAAMKPGLRTGSHPLSIGRISGMDLISSRPQTAPERHRRADEVGVCVIGLVDDPSYERPRPGGALSSPGPTSCPASGPHRGHQVVRTSATRSARGSALIPGHFADVIARTTKIVTTVVRRSISCDGTFRKTPARLPRQLILLSLCSQDATNLVTQCTSITVPRLRTDQRHGRL
jgi:hypothetical protein